jgi:hypothetical protein
MAIEWTEFLETEPRVVPLPFRVGASEALSDLDLPSYIIRGVASSIDGLITAGYHLLSQYGVLLKFRASYVERLGRVVGRDLASDTPPLNLGEVDWRDGTKLSAGIACTPLSQSAPVERAGPFERRIWPICPGYGSLKVEKGELLITDIDLSLLGRYCEEWRSLTLLCFTIRNLERTHGLKTFQRRLAHPKDFLPARADQSDSSTELVWQSLYGEARRNVILIHGFTATDESMSELGSYLSNDHRVFYFQYNSTIETIAESAQNLAGFVSWCDKQLHGALNGSLILVGHSKGGLVARSAICEFGMTAYVDKLIMLGTPNHGIDTQDIVYLLNSFGGIWLDRNASLEEMQDLRGFVARMGGFSAGSTKYITIPGHSNRFIPIQRRNGFWGVLGSRARASFLNVMSTLGVRLTLPHDGFIEDSSVNILSEAAHETISSPYVHADKYHGINKVDHFLLTENQNVFMEIHDEILKP